MFTLMVKYVDNAANDIDLQDYPAPLAASAAN
jgi:hypothetical protein